MKKLNKFIVFATLAIISVLTFFSFTGCSSVPTKLEQRYFEIRTNEITIVKSVTNVIDFTNYHTVVSNITSGTNIIMVTNVVPVVYPVTNITYSTNVLIDYTYTPNTNAQAISGSAQNIGNLFGPFGGLAGIITGGLFSLWGVLRSKKFKVTAEALSQIIETGSEILKTTPQGMALDQKWKAWMTQHQAETGTITEVLKILQNTTDNEEAKVAADKIINLLKT